MEGTPPPAPPPSAPKVAFFCAPCGKQQRPGSRHFTVAPATTAAAVCVHVSSAVHYNAGPIKACRTCCNHTNMALRLLRFAFPPTAAFAENKQKGKVARGGAAATATGSGPHQQGPAGTLRPAAGGDSSGTGIGNLPKLPQHPALGAAAGAAPGVGPNQNNPGGRARTVATNGGKCTMSHAVGGGMAGLSGLPPAFLGTSGLGSTTEVE